MTSRIYGRPGEAWEFNVRAIYRSTKPNLDEKTMFFSDSAPMNRSADSSTSCVLLDLGQGRTDALNRLTGPVLGGPCAALGLGDAVQHLAEVPLALDLLGLQGRQALGARGAGLSLGGSGLDLLQALGCRLERLDGALLVLRQPSLRLL